MKKMLFAIIPFIFFGCSNSKDTSVMSPEEYFSYAIELYNDEEYLESINEFNNILLQFPGSTVNDDARFYLGMSHFNREEYLLSAYEFSKLIRDMTASPFLEDAQYMLAESYYQQSPPVPLDQKNTSKAIDEFQEFIEFFPASSKVVEAEKKIKELNSKLAEKEFNNAGIYEKMGYMNAAIKYYSIVANDYHDTQFAPIALYNKINILKDRNRNSEALNDIDTFLLRYPNDENAPEIQKIQAALLGE